MSWIIDVRDFFSSKIIKIRQKMWSFLIFVTFWKWQGYQIWFWKKEDYVFQLFLAAGCSPGAGQEKIFGKGQTCAKEIKLVQTCQIWFKLFRIRLSVSKIVAFSSFNQSFFNLIKISQYYSTLFNLDQNFPNWIKPV